MSSALLAIDLQEEKKSYDDSINPNCCRSFNYCLVPLFFAGLLKFPVETVINTQQRCSIIPVPRHPHRLPNISQSVAGGFSKEANGYNVRKARKAHTHNYTFLK